LQKLKSLSSYCLLKA